MVIHSRRFLHRIGQGWIQTNPDIRKLKISSLKTIALVVANCRFLPYLTFPKSDMVLLAGDLFHDNKPTRRTLHKTMEIFKRYTMGPNPVQIQILSENNFANGEANYLQEFYSVGECYDVHAACGSESICSKFFFLLEPR
jgi:hypothetical protein